MARPKQYGDPISVPFPFAVKDKIVDLADTYEVAQVDIIRAAVTPEFLHRWEAAQATYENTRANQ